FLSKLFPVLLLAAFLKRTRLWYAALFALVVAAFYVPFLDAGVHLLDGARNYARYWLNNASFFQVLLYLGKSKTVAEVSAACIVLPVVVYLPRPQPPPLRSPLLLTPYF